MSILQTIKARKLQEVEASKRQKSIEELQQEVLFDRVVVSMTDSILKGSGIISEFKRASPSKGDINLNADAEDIVKNYQEAGVSGISVLTDQDFFKAREDDFKRARKTTSLPILRKEFIVDKYQIFQSKAMGADTILLIAAILNSDEVDEFTGVAHELGLEVLIEIHEASELDVLCGREDLVGVNNRNLNTFSVDLNRSIELLNRIGDKSVRIAESGISSEEDLIKLKRAGFDGFLIGEYLMKILKKGGSVQELINLAGS